MESGIRQKEIKFPENKKIAETFLPGDRVIIAKYSEMSVFTIRDMSLGYRRFNDKVKKAIIRMMNERAQLNQALEEIINQ
jgi:hypothetical protein